MTIRRATTADGALLASLSKTVQRLHAEARPDKFKPHGDSETLTLCYQGMIDSPETHVFIAETDNHAVGYVIAKVMRRPENPFTHALESVFVDQFCVVDGEQSKGYGSQLMEAVYEVARAENIQEIQLDVWNFNVHALEFYQKRGFVLYNQRLEMRLDEN